MASTFPNSNKYKEGMYSYKIINGWILTSCIILLFKPGSSWDAPSKLFNIIGNFARYILLYDYSEFYS